MVSGADFYDDENIFNTYANSRKRDNSPNETLELPIIRELVGDVNGKRVLDIGCGDGLYGTTLLEAGATQYTGIEPAQRMFKLAQKNLFSHNNADVHHRSAEQWAYIPDDFDLVISRLALHYVGEIASVFNGIYQTLSVGGKFVFSVEHPVITSCNRSLEQTGGLRQDWIVDDYFITGLRHVKWMGGEVIKYHRTIADYYALLQQVGFHIQALRESAPERQNFAENDGELFRRRQRIPLFLLFSAVKPN
ncbi:MAG: class I SAM-dependent methyltransferase [Aggregatilineales bacterium]